MIIGHYSLTVEDNIVDIGSGIGITGLFLALRFGKSPVGIELRKDLVQSADEIETLVYHHARRWGLWLPVPRRITGDVLKNEEIRLALERSTVVLINNLAFDPFCT
jgi:hypothetical protein